MDILSGAWLGQGRHGAETVAESYIYDHIRSALTEQRTDWENSNLSLFVKHFLLTDHS